MKRASVNYAFVRRIHRDEANVLIIRSPRASPAFKSDCETYIFFSPRGIKGGVNFLNFLSYFLEEI